MTYYPLCYFDRSSGHTDHFREFEAEAEAEDRDDDAIATAERWSQGNPMELWNRHRPVKRWNAASTAGS